MLLFRIYKYLIYRIRAINSHGIHSPFVYDFYNQVIKKRYHNKSIQKEIDRRYLRNDTKISFIEQGSNRRIETSVRAWTKKTWSGQSFSYFLIKLCEWLGASKFLETGTSLGTNLSIVSYAKTLKKVYSIEGSTELVRLAKELNFASEITTVEIIEGAVQQQFVSTLIKTQPEVVFLDADHQSKTTNFYMDAIEKHGSRVKAIVIHDIYWSADMNSSWQEIVSNEDYPLTIDCFHMGIVFPRIEIEKQHFILKY